MSEQIVATGLLAVGLGGTFAALSNSPTWPAFIRRWLLGIGFIAILLMAGVVLGMVSRSAMCAGPWICVTP